MFVATILTLFPAMFPGPLGQSLAGEALARKLWAMEARDIREHGLGRHRAVDDTPAGGGPGMVMRADVLAASLDAAVEPQRSAPAPRHERARAAVHAKRAPANGRRDRGSSSSARASRESTSESSRRAASSRSRSATTCCREARSPRSPSSTRACGSSPGSWARRPRAPTRASSRGLLEYPHYTRPREWEGRAIPDVLLKGDHAKIAEWRRREAERITRERRPDLSLPSLASGRRV